MCFVWASHPQYYLNLSVLFDFNLGFPLDQSGLLGLDLGFPLVWSGLLGHYLAYLQFSQLESLSAHLRQQGEVQVSSRLGLQRDLSVPLDLNLGFPLDLSGPLGYHVSQLALQHIPNVLYKRPILIVSIARLGLGQIESLLNSSLAIATFPASSALGAP